MSFAKFVPQYSLCQSLARTQALCAAAAGQSFVKSVAKTVEASHPELSTRFAPRQSVNELHPFGHLGAPIQSSQATACARAAECSCRCHSLLNRALLRATSKLHHQAANAIKQFNQKYTRWNVWKARSGSTTAAPSLKTFKVQVQYFLSFLRGAC